MPHREGIYKVFERQCNLLKIWVFWLVSHSPMMPERAIPEEKNLTSIYSAIISYSLTYFLISLGMCSIKCIFGRKDDNGYSTLNSLWCCSMSTDSNATSSGRSSEAKRMSKMSRKRRNSCQFSLSLGTQWPIIVGKNRPRHHIWLATKSKQSTYILF